MLRLFGMIFLLTVIGVLIWYGEQDDTRPTPVDAIAFGNGDDEALPPPSPVAEGDTAAPTGSSPAVPVAPVAREGPGAGIAPSVAEASPAGALPAPSATADSGGTDRPVIALDLPDPFAAPTGRGPDGIAEDPPDRPSGPASALRPEQTSPDREDRIGGGAAAQAPPAVPLGAGTAARPSARQPSPDDATPPHAPPDRSADSAEMAAIPAPGGVPDTADRPPPERDEAPTIAAEVVVDTAEVGVPGAPQPSRPDPRAPAPTAPDDAVAGDTTTLAPSPDVTLSVPTPAAQAPDTPPIAVASIDAGRRTNRIMGSTTAPAPTVAQPSSPVVPAEMPAADADIPRMSSAAAPPASAPVAAAPVPDTALAAVRPADLAVPAAAVPAPAVHSPPAELTRAYDPTPVFDAARVDAGRSVVLAGSAVPGSELQVLLNGEEVDRVPVDAAGDWVAVPPTLLNSGVYVLTLRAVDPATGHVTTGEQRLVVNIAPDGDPDGTFAVLVGEDVPSVLVQAPRPASQPQQAEPPAIGPSGPAADTPPGAPPGPGSAAIAAGPTGIEVPAEDPPTMAPAPTPAPLAQVAVDVIDYDARGALVISGRARPETEVRVYLDNALVGRAVTDARGAYRVTPTSPVPPGAYAMRVDQIGTAGTVGSRVEIPFVRAAQTDLSTGERRIIVQPGDYLWEIARQTYGTGFRFVVIYRANADQIRNPDLIYPGQVFTLPDIADAPRAPPG